MRKRLILVVDPEPAVVGLVRAELQREGYAVIAAATGEEALVRIEEDRPDLAVIALMLPGMSGFELLRRIRSQGQLPVILLTALGGDADKVRGLRAGADDFLTKPFNPEELSARIDAVLRRSASAMRLADGARLCYPGLEIDLERRRVVGREGEIRLSRTEWALLEQLAGHAGRVMLHGELLSRVWGPEFRDEVRYLRMWVSRLRTKLGPAARGAPLITTFPGSGYRLEEPSRCHAAGRHGSHAPLPRAPRPKRHRSHRAGGRLGRPPAES